MALRVLLADESQTIKKVIQLALQDFSVEVKPVHSGIDVLPIAKVFQPDIIFADVLLAKKSGYDVCKELKNNPETSKIPIVLMWNSLMGIDEKKAIESKADKRLEKPFEVETLRSLVQELAPKTVSNPISSFLNFGEIETFKEFNQSSQRKEQNLDSGGPNLTSATTSPQLKNLPDFMVKPPEPSSTDVFELNSDEDDFAQVQLSPNVTLPENDLSYSSLNQIDNYSEKDEWSQQKIETIPDTSLSGLNISLEEPLSPKKAYEEFLGDTKEEFSLPEDDLKKAKITVTESFEEIIFNDDVEPTGLPKAPQLNKKPTVATEISTPRVAMTPDSQEAIIREEARAIIEKICWTLLPEIAERVVREEIKKLLQDAEKSI